MFTVPRVRSDDYDDKIHAILDSAAALFAKVGYPNAKMQDIAKDCGASKSMLYHYFPTKDDLLFAMLEEHLTQVLEALEDAVAVPGTPPERFAALVQAYSQKSLQSRRRHVIAMNDVKFLPRPMQAPLKELQRRIIDLTTAQLQALRPDLDARLCKPYAMLLIGMVSWIDFWHRPNGPMKIRELSLRSTHLFLDGFMAGYPGDAPAHRR